mmetsp:Transcript_16480/g.24973  ORF Transcript_16480/g.24973 Transcript_16480/m.24973 type:complete len:125 (+) Transcript_16480:56-430(+)
MSAAATTKNNQSFCWLVMNVNHYSIISIVSAPFSLKVDKRSRKHSTLQLSSETQLTWVFMPSSPPIFPNQEGGGARRWDHPQLVVPILCDVAHPGQRMVPVALNDLQVPHLGHCIIQHLLIGVA